MSSEDVKAKIVVDLYTDIKWVIGCLQNFHPFNGDLSEGLDPTMYQTLTYKGDKELLAKFNAVKNRLAAKWKIYLMH